MEGCEAGCKHFSGGEIKHHKDCIHYEESFSQLYDITKEEVTKLRKRINDDENEILSNFLIWYWKEIHGKPYNCRVSDIVDDYLKEKG